MFMGTYNNSIDAKNRMIVPSKLRSQLKGDKCVITIGMERCLCIYSMEDWEGLAEKFKDSPLCAEITFDESESVRSELAKDAIYRLN